MALGFSLHIRAEEAIGKFQQEIEDDFQYLYEILSEAKQSFGRRDSYILLPKTPSMKRKRQESDEEHSSDDASSRMAREAKTHKTQGYASPLEVINENELLDCSAVNTECNYNDTKRTTRATRANSRAARQQPKRGSGKKNLPDIGNASKEQTPGSSFIDEQSRRTTRNPKKTNLELTRVTEEKSIRSSSSNEVKDLPRRTTRSSRRKEVEENSDVSLSEKIPRKPVAEITKSSTDLISKDSGDITPLLIVKQEVVSTCKKSQAGQIRVNTEKNDKLTDSVAKTEPDLVSETLQSFPIKAKTPTTSPKICKTSINVVLQSPALGTPNGDEVIPIMSSSLCHEKSPNSCASKELGLQNVTLEENQVLDEEPLVNNSETHEQSPTKAHVSCQEFIETSTAKNKDDVGTGVGSLSNDENNPVSENAKVDLSKEVVTKKTTLEPNPVEKSLERSRGRSSGWRRKSKRLSNNRSPSNRRLSMKQKVTKSKVPGKKSLVKSSVKLKLTHSKLMPELKIHSAEKQTNGENIESNLEDVKVRLFDNSTSETSSQSASSATNSSYSSSEDKAEVLVEKIAQEFIEDELEVFHDCRGSENEDIGEADDEKYTETKSEHSPTLEHANSSVIIVQASDGSSGEESAPNSREMLEDPMTPPSQETLNPSHKSKPNNIAVVHSFIRRNTPKKVDPEEKKKQLRNALKEKEEKEKERREQLEIQRQREIEERKRKREERAKKAAEQRVAKLQALEEKKRQAQDQRQILMEKAKKLKEKEEEDKKKQRIQKRAEIEGRKKQEEAARLQKIKEQEEEEKRQREMLQKRQELEEQERQRRIIEAKRHQEHREKELEKERELEKQKKLKAIEEKEKRLREKEEKERKTREEKLRIEREKKAQEDKEKEERERARIAQLIREKEEHTRREREQRAKEEKERQEREKKLKEEREAALREKKRQEQIERERTRVLEERKLAEENKKLNSSTTCNSYEMTPPPVKVRKPASSENYNIADLQSDESTDDEDNPRKRIPSWARPPALKAAIFHQEYSNIDVNSIFDDVPKPNLEDIFKHATKKKRFNQRTSSAMWDSPPLRQAKKGTYV